MRPTALVLGIALVFGLACTGGGMDTAKPLTPATDPAEPPTAADAEEGTDDAAAADDGAATCCAGPPDCDGCPPSYREADGECAGTMTSGPECEPVCCALYEELGLSSPSEKANTLRGNCVSAPPFADAKILNDGQCATGRPATKKTTSTSMSGSGSERTRTRTRAGAGAGAGGGGRVNRGGSTRRAATTDDAAETEEETEATEETKTETTSGSRTGRRPNR